MSTTQTHPAAKPHASDPPVPPETPPAHVYVDVAAATWAEWRSLEASNIAAGQSPSQLAVKIEATPQEFPKLLYNATTRTTKVATSKDDEKKDTGEGFSEQPFPAEDPNALTPEDVQAIETLFAKAGQAVTKVATAVEKQGKPPDKAAAPAPAKK